MADLCDQIQTWLQERKAMIGLDFDGTLVGLNPDPEAVRLSVDARQVIERLAGKYVCSLISGRMISDLRPRALLKDVHYIGTHGAEIEKCGGPRWQFEDRRWSEWRAAEWPAFEAWVIEKGGRIEDKGISFSVHYRNAAEQSVWWQAEGLNELSRRFEGIAEVFGGESVWNITPRGAPHKGHSAEQLCRETGCDSLIYFGDEETDENVFRLTHFPVLGVKIGPGQTAASWRLANHHEVLALLKRLA